MNNKDTFRWAAAVVAGLAAVVYINYCAIERDMTRQSAVEDAFTCLDAHGKPRFDKKTKSVVCEKEEPQNHKDPEAP